jgi:hypothetical protein
MHVVSIVASVGMIVFAAGCTTVVSNLSFAGQMVQLIALTFIGRAVALATRVVVA